MNRLKEIRKLSGLEVKELAELTGLHVHSICKGKTSFHNPRRTRMTQLNKFDEAINRLQAKLAQLKKERRSRILGIINTNEALNPDGLIADMTKKIQDVELSIKTLQEEGREVKRVEAIAQLETQKKEAQARIEQCTAEIDRIKDEIESFTANASQDELDIVKNSPMGLTAFPRLKGLFFKIENLQARVTHDLEQVRELNDKPRQLSEL